MDLSEKKQIALAFTAKTSTADNVVDFAKEYQENLKELLDSQDTSEKRFSY